jgi:hypothetical protein
MSAALPDWLFENFLFSTWPGRWLQGGPWEQFSTALSIALSLGASGLWMLEERARRIGHHVPERLSKAVGTGIAVLSFLVYFDFFNPNTRYIDYYHRHEFYHYYLGSKYFDEVGYKRLYACTAIAESESGRAEVIRRGRIRDLGGHNLLVPMTETIVFRAPEECKRHFSAARWQAFKADVAWFERTARGSYWDKMKTDHGYNPPPVWTMTGKLWSSLAPAGDHFFKLLAALDVLLQLGALLTIGWAFGWRVMTLASVFWGCNAPASSLWTVGAFLRQDWFFLFILALCLAHKRRFALSGAALTWSALLRIFPVLAFAGVGLIIVLDTLERRRLRTDYRQFMTGSVAAAVVLVSASALVSGVGSHAAFADHIRGHKDTPLTNNMGLEVMLAHDWDGRMAFTVDERLEDSVQPWKEGHARRVHATRPWLVGVSLVVAGWLAWALRRTKLLWLGMALSLPLWMCLLSLTCYYYVFFTAAAVLVRKCRALAPAYLALPGASQVLIGRFYWYDDRYTAQSYLFLAFALCTLYALSPPPDWTRLRAWWKSQPLARRSG